ncbi:MAG TPA: DUF459 domain-containing protein, partial [Mycobacteriales bacterium]|nr:DUF459 domain-containing protein [Mycobacteriales bacterium]
MTDIDPAGADPLPDETRRARLAARRRQKTRVAVGAIVVLVAAAVAVAACALNNDATSNSHASEQATSPLGPANELPEVAAANKQKPVRALDHAHPLRLWVGGDSLAGSFGPSLGDLVSATGVVATQIDYKVSSGLWSNDIRDWYGRATEQMRSANPEAVVFMIGTNDTPVVNNVDANHNGIPDWEELYRVKVARMMDLFVGSTHRTVFWLGAPTLGTKSLDSAAVKIDKVAKAEAAKRSPDVVFVDTYRMFEGPDGSYSRTIVDETGSTITARIGDGVHFTPSGAQYLAHAVFRLIDARWHLKKQADPAQPIEWSLASGSGENVPGYASPPRPRYVYRTP